MSDKEKRLTVDDMPQLTKLLDSLSKPGEFAEKQKLAGDKARGIRRRRLKDKVEKGPYDSED